MMQWPKYVGTLRNKYYKDQCQVDCTVGQVLKLVAEPPKFDSNKLIAQSLYSSYFTEADEYVVDAGHYYMEIWNFLLHLNRIQVNTIVSAVDDTYYYVDLQVYLLRDAIDYKLEQDLIHSQVSTELKELLKFGKDSFTVLCTMLQIKYTIRALLSPLNQTKLLDDLLLNKYKQKPYYYRLYLANNLQIPQLIINQYPEYYQVQVGDTIQQQKFDQMAEQVNVEQEDQVQQIRVPTTLQQYRTINGQQDLEDTQPSILSINEQVAKQFTLCTQPSKLITPLFPYQAQGVQWMLYKEGIITAQELNLLNEEQRLNRMWSQIELPGGDLLYLNEFSGELQEEFVEFKEAKGGIIADQMGLGKTIMSIALILNGVADIPEKPRKRVKGSIGQGGTLLVVQLSVFSHWIDQITEHTVKNSVQVYEYYSKQSRKESIQLNVYDVVITTYGILGREYKQGGNLFNYKWRRVILDEAHTIKGRGTTCAKAASHLITDVRWCLTGTPLQNCLDDLFSLFHFLHIDTFADYFWFNTYVNKQTNQHEKYNLIHKILTPIMLRRTKESTYINGEIILSLPTKHQDTVSIRMNQEELRIYSAFFRRTQQELKILLQGNKIKKSFIHIFQILTFLRQLCDNPYLFFNQVQLKSKTDQQSLLMTLDNFFYSKLNNNTNINNNADDSIDDDAYFDGVSNEDDIIDPQPINPGSKEFQEKVINQILTNSVKTEYCAICLDILQDKFVVLKCGHYFDYQCYTQLPVEHFNCPSCRKRMNPTKDATILTRKQSTPLTPVKVSSKIAAVLADIQIIIGLNQKVVVYSQWLSVLNFIQGQLRVLNIDNQRFDGRMSKEQRSQAIKIFNTTYCPVMLVSLKAGAYGINLTAANHALIVDPWWNPAVEDQAIERIHRLGQKNEIFIKNYICISSIEERVIELHHIKRRLFQDALHLKESDVQLDIMSQIRYIMEE